MENKTSKYFKYAIGEIVLVVIGILIALQINNWNEQKKLKQQEVTSYCKLHEDLTADISNINNTLLSLSKRQAVAKTFLINLLKIQEDKSILLRDYIPAVRSLKFIPTKAAIVDITSSGKLENLKNQTLKNAILNFYVEQDKLLAIIENNDERLAQQDIRNNQTDFGYQELPLYQHIYGSELKQLLKSTDWQKDTNNIIFKNLKNYLNVSLIVCEREKDLLNTIRKSSIDLKKQLTAYCK
ncbi:MAG: DUF6090 family protein [Flaviramulus sp.]|nr:DUF6090 family protein [Flaviramulus sp.]